MLTHERIFQLNRHRQTRLIPVQEPAELLVDMVKWNYCLHETEMQNKGVASNEPSLKLIRIFVNPLSANSDQQQFSPNNIHTLSRDKVMRINKMITKGKMPWSFIKFLSTSSLRKCMEISLENLYVDISTLRVKIQGWERQQKCCPKVNSRFFNLHHDYSNSLALPLM